MSTPIKFFREREQAETTQRFLSEHTIKTFLRERGGESKQTNEQVFGYDLFVLREDDVDEAKQLVSYEFGSSWGATEPQ
jgi:predicted nucleotidyltransferase